MHLIEQYALACTAKIDKPYIYEKYYPIPFEKYITFSPHSKPSKNYDYWKEVVDMILPDLREMGISIVQLGGKADKALESCFSLCGKTNINQSSYLIKRAIMHFGTDTFTTQIASAFDKKIVALYSHSPIQNCKPFWSKEKDVVLIESDRQGKKHSFALEENPKTINTIAPERIAQSVLKMLGVNRETKHKTIRIGPKWNNEFLEIIPKGVVSFSKEVPKDRHVIRMDYHFDEEVLQQQLLVNPGLIVTPKPISMEILNKNKERISQVIYLVRNDNYDSNFSRELDKNNIQNSIYSDLEGESLKKLKYSILNLNKPISLIQKKSIEDLPNHKELDCKKLNFKSRKFIIEGDDIYPGRAAYLNNKKIKDFNSGPIPIMDQKEFWEEIDFFWITEQA